MYFVAYPSDIEGYASLFFNLLAVVNHNLLVTLFFNKFHSSIRPDSFAWSALFPCPVPVLVSFAGSKRWFGGSKR